MTSNDTDRGLEMPIDSDSAMMNEAENWHRSVRVMPELRVIIETRKPGSASGLVLEESERQLQAHNTPEDAEPAREELEVLSRHRCAVHRASVSQVRGGCHLPWRSIGAALRSHCGNHVHELARPAAARACRHNLSPNRAHSKQEHSGCRTDAIREMVLLSRDARLVLAAPACISSVKIGRAARKRSRQAPLAARD